MPFDFNQLENSLIVSCQPVKGGAMDKAGTVVGFALAALDGGAIALRIESVDYVRAVRDATARPIIGLVKRDLEDSPVRISSFIEDIEALAAAGADIIAYDATNRVRPVSTRVLIERIHALGKVAMADCSILADAERALVEGAEIVGTTLAGYTGSIEPAEPDFALMRGMRALTPYVIAEGCVRTPKQAAKAHAWGEYAFGAGRCEDMVFLTISTGIGGGIVTGGRLLDGLGGHFGQFRDLDHPDETLEDRVSGRWIAAQAASHAPDATARDVFAAAYEGESWAAAILDASARQAANLCRNVQLAFDPRRIVIGGSIGLAGGYLAAMKRALETVPPRLKPSLHAADLAEHAGTIGIADLAQRHQATMRKNGQ